MSQFKAFMLVAAAAAVTVPVALAVKPHASSSAREVTVMSRNLYLGTDLNPILTATSAPALFAAVGTGWAQVQANDFPARAEAIADEIAAAEPDLVGLQEAMVFRTDSPPDGPASPADTVVYDFVDLLVAALADRGLAYESVSRFDGTEAELPAGLPPTVDVRLSDGVAILARRDAKTAELKLSNPQDGAYSTHLTVDTVAGSIPLPRGWASIDVKIRGKSFRFVTTHLEAFAAPIRSAQAAELVAGPVAGGMPAVVVGDMNSGPGADAAAYQIIVDAGFVDTWPGGPGPTCCHAVDLHDADPTLTKRIDLVLAKGGFETTRADVVGDETADRTADGLWPSDHAGVVTTLELPKGE
jgi:endonuclease/exonuclease/phosphatase family metal-dependent hydrolase